MCDGFPRVTSCCVYVTIKMGLIYIGVLAVGTGSLMAMMAEKNRNVNFTTFKYLIHEPSKLNFSYNKIFKERYHANRALNAIIPHALVAIGGMFMIGGLLCYYASLYNSPCIMQMAFVFLFLAVMGGLAVCLVITIECVLEADKCALRDMDWLSGGFFLMLLILYFVTWIYYLSVCNAYLLDS